MRGIARGAPLVLAAALAACISAPDRVDPLAGLEAAAPAAAYPGLSLAVTASENTRRAAGYSAHAQALSLGSYKASTPFDETIDFLKRNFRSVTRAESAEATAADLHGVLDLYASIGSTIFTESRFEARLILTDSDGRSLGEARGIGVKLPTRDTPFSLIGETRVKAAYAAARAEALANLDKSLRELPELTRYAAARSVAPGNAAVVPRSYHSDVETPSFRFDEDPNKFAVVIGVEHYASLPPAEHAKRDALAVKAHLLALGYPERNIFYAADAWAGKSAFEKAFEAWLPRSVGPDSTVFVYFSGHGAPNPATGQAYLVPADGDAKFLEVTGFPTKRLYADLSALKAKKVMLVMDSCFSGAGGRSVIARGTRPLVASVDTGATAAGNVAVLSASASDEISGTDEAAGHGLLTYYFLKELDRRQGRATFRQLYDGLSPRVRDAARRDNRDQTPQLAGKDAAAP